MLTPRTNPVIQCICRNLTRILITKQIHTSSVCPSYYEALGVHHGATQVDIKAAYYKLSKQYHPDKNQGCEDSAKKFRQISQAYEVLGNYKLRKLYDKGILPSVGPNARQPDFEDMEPVVEDDAETKFYKSRFRKSKVADSEGRTPIYDFDEWSRAHYGKTFERRQKAKVKYSQHHAKEHHSGMLVKNEIIIMGALFSLIIIIGIFCVDTTYDVPRNNAKRLAEQKQIDEKKNALDNGRTTS